MEFYKHIFSLFALFYTGLVCDGSPVEYVSLRLLTGDERRGGLRM